MLQARLALDAIFAAYDKSRSELSRSREKENRLLNVAAEILNAINDIRVVGANRPDVTLFKGNGTVNSSSTWKEDSFFDAKGAFQTTDRCLLETL